MKDIDDRVQGRPAADAGTAQAKKKRRPAPLAKSYQKVPFHVRVNCDITPANPDFVLVEQYFSRQLRNERLTMKDILEGHFTATEIEQFVPSTKDSIAEIQQHNTLHYQKLLATTFKDKLPTLECKMAMLYFGLPVAPMKLAPYQYMDADLLASFNGEDSHFDQDPLEFLDEYTQNDIPIPGRKYK
jgi:hypothetical protein